MLQVQNIGNLYRKNAYRFIHKYLDKYSTTYSSTEAVPLDQLKSATPATPNLKRINSTSSVATPGQISIQVKSTLTEEKNDIAFIDQLSVATSLHLFNESIDFSLAADVPDSVSFSDKLKDMLKVHDEFIRPDQRPIAEK